MPKININVVIVCGSSSVDQQKFTSILTESYLPTIQVQEQNGCTVTKTILTAGQTEVFDGTAQANNDTPTKQGQETQEKLENYDLEISFWNINPKEHLWQRLKALQLYETANVLLMLYNADDLESFESLSTIHNEFKEANQVGAYKVLISVITKEIATKKTKKAIKKQQALDFIEQQAIPSYIEVRLDNKKNISVLDQHLRFIMNPNIEEQQIDMNSENAFIYRPLFEVISLKTTKKKKKNKAQNDWVSRLYQQKQDFSRLYKDSQLANESSMYNTTINQSRMVTQQDDSFVLPSSKKNTNKKKQASNLYPQNVTNIKRIQSRDQEEERPSLSVSHSVINLYSDTKNEHSKVADYFSNPPFESDQKANNTLSPSNFKLQDSLQNISKFDQEQFLIHPQSARNNNANHQEQQAYMKAFTSTEYSNASNFHNQQQLPKIDDRTLTREGCGDETSSAVQSSLMQFDDQINKKKSNSGDKKKRQTKHVHQISISNPNAVKCPYHHRGARSKSPPKRNENNKEMYEEVESYMSKKKIAHHTHNRSIGYVPKISPKYGSGGPKLQGKGRPNQLEYLGDIDQNQPSFFDQRISQNVNLRIFNENDQQQNNSDRYNYEQQLAYKNRLQQQLQQLQELNNRHNEYVQSKRAQMNSAQTQGMNAARQGESSYQELKQRNYKTTKTQTNPRNSPRTQQKEDQYIHHYERMYLTKDKVPLEEMSYRPGKDRGYGCSRCNIF